MTLGGVLIQNQLREKLIPTISGINLASGSYSILETATETDMDQHNGNTTMKSILINHSLELPHKGKRRNRH